MDYIYYDNMTNKQKEQVDFVKNIKNKEIELCNKMLKEAIQSNQISLPMETETGESVLAGSKKEITSIITYWEERKYLAERYI